MKKSYVPAAASVPMTLPRILKPHVTSLALCSAGFWLLSTSGISKGGHGLSDSSQFGSQRGQALVATLMSMLD